MEAIKNDGTVKKLQDRYFGEGYFAGRAWLYLFYGLIGVAGVAFFLLVWNFTLRRAVRHRTKLLDESNDLFQLFLEHSPIYMFFKDENLRSLKLSRNYEKLQNRPLAELLGKTSGEVYPPEIAEKILEMDLRVLRELNAVEFTEVRKGRVFNTIKFPILREGEPPLLAGFSIDITEKRQAEQRLLQSLEEKETLLRELYHRTNNTMQIVRGMLILQAADFPDNEDLQRLVRNTDGRIQAISLVQQMLYKGQNLSRIPMATYIRNLTDLAIQNQQVRPARIKTELRIEDIHFLLDAAIPVGLILNELLTNSLNHAFPAGASGRISVDLAKIGEDELLLVYTDDGVGLPADFNFGEASTLGFKLIYSLAEQQLRGKVELSGKNGFRCELRFNVGRYSARI